MNSDSRLEGWLVEQAGQFAQTTTKDRDARLRKLTGEIKKAEHALLAAEKEEAIERLEARFADKRAAVEAEFADEAA